MVFSLATQEVLFAAKTNRCLHPIINLKHCTLHIFACLQTGNSHLLGPKGSLNVQSTACLWMNQTFKTILTPVQNKQQQKPCLPGSLLQHHSSISQCMTPFWYALNQFPVHSLAPIPLTLATETLNHLWLISKVT